MFLKTFYSLNELEKTFVVPRGQISGLVQAASSNLFRIWKIKTREI